MDDSCRAAIEVILRASPVLSSSPNFLHWPIILLSHAGSVAAARSESVTRVQVIVRLQARHGRSAANRRINSRELVQFPFAPSPRE